MNSSKNSFLKGEIGRVIKDCYIEEGVITPKAVIIKPNAKERNKAYQDYLKKVVKNNA